ncbi:hypothetical protein PSJ8397_01553 [Pseudooctadecabacter jejudonensis]|uniref:Uncharacterized protein n=1 Tax=Pseudooctadecabacter jejudonensis TaxID=1391910 RepID=A0A1Y5S7F2_9RHOB|nr:hypothetical protein PSJ8397_01553 [Pseudooctadecabacter jejudonensis]
MTMRDPLVMISISSLVYSEHALRASALRRAQSLEMMGEAYRVLSVARAALASTRVVAPETQPTQ